MKKIYIFPRLHTVKFDLTDIITHSNGTDLENSGIIIGPRPKSGASFTDSGDLYIQ